MRKDLQFLSKVIYQARLELNEVGNSASLTDPLVIGKSQRLDRLLNRYVSLQKKEKSIA